MNDRAYAKAQVQQKTLSGSLPTNSLLQRSCACGQHTLAGGECEECRKKREGILQRAAVSSVPVNAVPPVVHSVLSSPGQPLDVGTRTFMESRFGHDFSQVQVHTDAQAADSAQALNALAYTVRQDIVFGAGQYAPRTSQGQRLLAHELVHVAQQRAGRVSPPQGKSSPVVDNQSLEAEADELGSIAARGEPIVLPDVGSSPGEVIHHKEAPIQRQKKGNDTEAKKLEHLLNNITLDYLEIVDRQVEGVKKIKEGAEKSKEPPSLLIDVLAFAAEVALSVVSGRVGEKIAKRVEEKITSKLVADMMKEAAEDLVQTSAKETVKKVAKDKKATPQEVYFDGQVHFYQEQEHALREKFENEGKQKISDSADPLGDATTLHSAIEEERDHAQDIAEEETLKGWLSYLPKSILGVERGPLPEPWEESIFRDVPQLKLLGVEREDKGTTTKFASHSDLFTPAREGKVKGLLYLFMDQTPDANIEKAQLAGADVILRNRLEGRKLVDLKIPFVMKSIERYEIMVNEEGIANWDSVRTNFTWLSQFARTKRRGGNAVMEEAAEGAFNLVEKIRERPLPAVTD